MADSVVVDSYRELMAKNSVDGISLAKVSYIRLGSGGYDSNTNQPLSYDSSITGLRSAHPYDTKVDVSTAVNGVQFIAVVEITDVSNLNGMELSESGLFDANDNLIAYKGFSATIKDANQSMTFKMTVIF